MSHPQEIRDLVVQSFGRFGLNPAQLAGLEDSILLYNSRYFGRSFRAGGYQALWLADAHVISIYDPQGALVRTLDLRYEADSIESKAA